MSYSSLLDGRKIFVNGIDISDYLIFKSITTSVDVGQLMETKAEVIISGEVKVGEDGAVYIGDYKEVKRMKEKEYKKKIKKAKRISQADRSLIF